MYLDHRTVDDKCNIIVDCYITKGNVHDSGPFINRAEYIKNTFNFNIKKYAVDSGYLTLDIKKYFIDNNIFGVFGYRRFGTSESRKEKTKYEYNKELDIYIEKETGEVLEYGGLIDRNGYKKYQNLDKTKIVRRHIHEEWNEIFKQNKLSEEGKIKELNRNILSSFINTIYVNEDGSIEIVLKYASQYENAIKALKYAK